MTPPVPVPPRILVVTAVEAERDAVTGAVPAPPAERALPGGALLHRVPLSPVSPDASGPDAPGSGAAGTLDVLAGGVGPAAAASAAATALTAAALGGHPYALVVSAGIGGGFPDPAATTGEPRGERGAQVTDGAPDAGEVPVVLADEIVAADLGAATGDGFLPVTELGFGTDTHRPPAPLVRAAAAAVGARCGGVLTVSTVTGSAERAAELAARHPRAAAEAMEGFGVAEAAAAHGVPVLELRTVSNPVGPRDRAAWRVGAALTTLTTAFRNLLAAPLPLPTGTGGPSGAAGAHPAERKPTP
ncbi:futalosine hydrolase [Streptomyces sp. AJS327]|uniref:futalosine hydrolase n=1 Tax=Streptomyces sp. AJS327 TaxID=2545265 RepID=UPI0015DDDB27|nr:futalosine hydrolase [Streptomyces sp. AJS327]MBA0053152.1 futalosine hydrolase [Streptomyces sp. AJS327]